MEKEGIVCPACGKMESYKSHNSAIKRQPGELVRVKQCECGQTFKTIEVLVGICEVKKRG